MHETPAMRTRRTIRAAQAGFTLVELMIVVAILGILAAISIVSFRRYILRTRVQEAYSNLSLIRQRQESYRSEFSQYADPSGTGTSSNVNLSGSVYTPSTPAPGVSPTAWGGPYPLWDQLGFRPTGLLYYRYASTSGGPGVVPATGSGLGYSSSPNQDTWFIAHAYGNINGNSITSTFEIFSPVPTIYTVNELE